VHAHFRNRSAEVRRRHTPIQKKADVRGYLGLPGPIRPGGARRQHHLDNPYRPTNTNLLGGAATVARLRRRYKAGDNLVAVSAELRVPITSPLNLGRLGVKAFIDAGTVYGAGQKLKDQNLDDRGIGGGVYLRSHAGELVARRGEVPHRRHAVTTSAWA
jgi:hypothetical protein